MNINKLIEEKADELVERFGVKKSIAEKLVRKELEELKKSEEDIKEARNKIL